MKNEWKEERILIWGKTYPELSSKYYETVCTGGTLENGSFIRLYPIPFRYLSGDVQFNKYQWIRARIKKSEDDPRPESYKVDPESIVLEDKIKTDVYEWFNRKNYVFKNDYYSFNCFEALFLEYRKNGTSIGFVRPSQITKIYIENRPVSDHEAFLKKFEENRERSKQMELFGPITVSDIRQLQFISKRFKVDWFCSNPKCKGHKMSILDWEVYELARKTSMEKALERLTEILTSGKYNVGFFLGNFRLYPFRFAIGGIWYPEKSNLAPNLTLF